MLILKCKYWRWIFSFEAPRMYSYCINVQYPPALHSHAPGAWHPVLLVSFSSCAARPLCCNPVPDRGCAGKTVFQDFGHGINIHFSSWPTNRVNLMPIRTTVARKRYWTILRCSWIFESENRFIILQCTNCPRYLISARLRIAWTAKFSAWV